MQFAQRTRNNELLHNLHPLRHVTHKTEKLWLLHSLIRCQNFRTSESARDRHVHPLGAGIYKKHEYCLTSSGS